MNAQINLAKFLRKQQHYYKSTKMKTFENKLSFPFAEDKTKYNLFPKNMARLTSTTQQKYQVLSN